jgi:hypothetical protein
MKLSIHSLLWSLVVASALRSGRGQTMTLIWMPLTFSDCRQWSNVPLFTDMYMVADPAHPCLQNASRPWIPWALRWALRSPVATALHSGLGRPYLDIIASSNLDPGMAPSLVGSPPLRVTYVDSNSWRWLDVNETDVAKVLHNPVAASTVFSNFFEYWWPRYGKTLFPLSRPRTTLHLVGHWPSGTFC